MGKGKKKAAVKQKPFKLDMSFEEAIRLSIQTKIPRKQKMSIKNLFANEIQDDGRYRMGIAVLDRTVLENVRIIYGQEVGQKILHQLTHSHPDGAYLLDRFCQFVVFIQFQPSLGFSMRFSDFAGSVDFALDEILELRDNEWVEEDREKLMTLFQKIENTPHGMGEIVIVDPSPLP